MNPIQERLFQIFIEFDRVCSLLGLRYFAIGGTALGAVRHNGFIPWDDDMDFGMPRRDYEIFIKEAPKHLNKSFFIQTHETDYYWFAPFMKIRDSSTTAIEHIYKKLPINHGLWIDVFPIDRVPNSRFRLFVQSIIQLAMIRRLAIIEDRKKTTKRVLTNVVAWLASPSKRIAYKILTHITTKFNNNQKFNYSSIPLYPLPKKNSIYPISLLDELILVKFESANIPVFKEYDVYLKIKYGNWKQIPPPDKRKSGHTISYLNLDESFENIVYLPKENKYATKK